MTILIDARYFGDALRSVRHHGGGINVRDMQKVLGVSHKTLHKYERGQEIIPYDTLKKLIRCGVYLILARGHK